MKNSTCLTVLLVAVIMPSCIPKSGDQIVPDLVKSSFVKQFPLAEKVEWEKEDSITWEAVFNIKGKSYSANFRANGNWVETEHEIEKSEIPSGIRAILDKHFEAYTIEDAELVETSTGTFYALDIEQGEDVLEITIDPSGELTQNKNNDDEED